MPTLNFNKRFVSQIESGVKRQTIRRMRKIPIKQGDKLYLFTGLRTKQCKNILANSDAKFDYTKKSLLPEYYNHSYTPYEMLNNKLIRTYVICKSVEHIKIKPIYLDTPMEWIEIQKCDFKLYDKFMSFDEVSDLIKKDGFENIMDFVRWFKNDFNKPLQLIKW